jgi:hypothetical protein
MKLLDIKANVNWLKVFSFKNILFAAIFALSYGIAFHNFYYLSKDMIYGDESGSNVFPPPQYGFMRMPDSSYESKNRLAGDYAQIYFPSQKFEDLSSNYKWGVNDLFFRSSRYAPFLHYVCSISFCKFTYGYASFLHMLTQLLLFFAAFAVSFKALGVESDIKLGFLLATVLLFVTPVGISWYERGQFSLYVAIAHLLLIVGLLKNKPILVIISAFFAYVKWTSFTVVFVIFVVDFFTSRNSGDLIRKMKVAAGYALTLALLSLPFYKEFIPFLGGLLHQELHIIPQGVSLNHLLSPFLSKWSLFLVVLIGCVLAVRKNSSADDLLPFYAGAGIFLLIYPTVAYEYNIPNLLPFIPLLFAWAKQGKLIRHALKFTFFFFIIFISYYSIVLFFIDAIAVFFKEIAVIVIVYVYVLSSVLFIFAPIFVPFFENLSGKIISPKKLP